MIQFNLLPDIKLEYIRAAKLKRLVVSISALVCALVLVVVGLLTVSVVGLQKKHISNLDADISAYRKDLETTEDVDKILTIQNQLKSIPGLHDQKPATTRVFTYLAQLIPSAISIEQFDISFTENTIDIVGEADAIITVNQLVDTMKFTNYVETIDGAKQAEVSAFSDVVLESLSRSDDKTSFKVTLKFAPEIFNNTKNISLVVPNQETTRSELGKPKFESSQGGSQ